MSAAYRYKFLVLDDNVVFWEMSQPRFNKHNIQLEVVTPSDLKTVDQCLTTYDLIILHDATANGQSAITRIKSALRGATFDSPVAGIAIDNRPTRETPSDRWKALAPWIDVRATLPMISNPSDYLIHASRKNFVMPEQVQELVLSMPQPTRVLDRNNRPALVNKKWNWEASYPDPKPEKVISPLDFVPPLPGDHAAYWKLNEFMFQEYRVQFAVAQPQSNSFTLDQEVHELWHLCEELGFAGMRFYRVFSAPESNHVMLLRNVFHRDGLPPRRSFNEITTIAKAHGVSIWPDEKGQYFHILSDGVVQRNLDSMLKRIKDMTRGSSGGKLITSVYTAENSSPVVLFLHDALNLSNSRAIYVPIVRATRDRLVALAILEPGNVNKEERSFLDESLRRRETSVLHAVERIRNHIRHTQRRRLNAMRRSADEFLREAMPTEITQNTVEVFRRKLIRKALNLSGYTLATLAWRHTDHGQHIIRGIEFAGRYSTKKRDRIKTVIGEPANTSLTPAVSGAINRKEAVFFQGKLAAEECPEDLNSRDPRFALPLRVAKNQCYGAIGFAMNKVPYRFLTRDIEALERFVGLCTPVLFSLEQALNQREFQSGVLHELAGAAASAMHAIRETSESQPRKQAIFYLQEMLARASDFHFNEAQEVIDASELIRDQMKFFHAVAPNFYKRIEMNESCASARLLGRPSVFRFAVQTLLSNALRHGETGSYGTEIVTKVRTLNDEGEFAIIVENPGYMSEEELNSAFDRFGLSVQNSGGSHVALSTLKRELTQEKARLQIACSESNGSSIVRATVNWPLVSGETNNDILA